MRQTLLQPRVREDARHDGASSSSRQRSPRVEEEAKISRTVENEDYGRQKPAQLQDRPSQRQVTADNQAPDNQANNSNAVNGGKVNSVFKAIRSLGRKKN